MLALGFLSAPARIFFADDLSMFWSGQNVSSRPRGVVAGQSAFGACEAWFGGAPSIVLGAPTATAVILHVRMELPFAVSPVTGAASTVKPRVITLAATEFGATQMTLRLRGYDEENDRLLFTTELDGARHLVSYSAETGIVDADPDPHRLVSSVWRMIPIAGSPGGMLIDRRSGRRPTAHLPVARRGLPAAAAPQLSRRPSKGEQHWRSRRRHGTSAPKLPPQATLATQVAQ